MSTCQWYIASTLAPTLASRFLSCISLQTKKRKKKKRQKHLLIKKKEKRKRKKKEKRKKKKKKRRSLRYGPVLFRSQFLPFPTSVSSFSHFARNQNQKRNHQKPQISAVDPSHILRFPAGISQLSNGTILYPRLHSFHLRTPSRMMELADSSDEHPQLNDLPNPTDSTTRSGAGTGIGIDLNQIPSPSSFSETLSDTFDVVRSFHDNPPPSDGDPAHVPRGVRGSVCSLCGQPEVRGHVVVCDGCERGFHLACTGMRGAHALNLEDWVCGDCFSSGVKSKRWPLGVKSKQLLDINASPPSDGDAYGEDGEELPGFRYGVFWVKWGIVGVVTFGSLLVLAAAVIFGSTSFEFPLHENFESGSLHVREI